MNNQDKIDIDITYGIVAINTFPIIDKDGNMQYVTRINDNGEVTEHQAQRIVYNDTTR